MGSTVWAVSSEGEEVADLGGAEGHVKVVCV